MRTDTELLDELTDIGKRTKLPWICRPSSTGRGLRLHQDPFGKCETPREAIDSFLNNEAKP